MRFVLFFVLFGVGVVSSWTERGSTREVRVQQGTCRGFIAGWDHPALRSVEIFLGIPYAAAPVGSLRYMPPQSPQTWGEEVKQFINFAPVCPQILPTIERDRKKMTQGQANYLKRLVPYLKVQSEDCLTLNIYAPSQEEPARSGLSSKRPVLVFIHGESFSWSSGNPYDGSVLASYGDILVVTVNFRLGVLGFLKSSAKVSNLGLLDQIAALKWLKDNIAQFGGDPNSVTLMGHHTGAVAVNHLMFSPIVIADQSPGLFQRVILMSGSALAAWSEMQDPNRNMRAVADQLGCDLSDDDSFQECLRERSVGELLNLNFPDEFGPSVGDMVLPGENVKTSPQYKGFYSRYDLMCGFVENECYHMLDAVSIHNGMLEKDRDRILTEFFNSTFKSYPQLVQKRATEFYSKSGNTFRAQPYYVARDAVLGILNDVRVINPILQTALHHANSSPSPKETQNKDEEETRQQQMSNTFLYVFSHKTSKSEYTGTDESVHGEELPYIFGVPLGGQINHFQSNYNHHEKLLSEVMMTMWSNFVKTGDPNVLKRYNYLTLTARDWAYFEKLKWPKFESHNQSFYEFALRPGIGNWYRSEHMEFWNNDLPAYLDKHEKNQKEREDPFFFPPFPRFNSPRGFEPDTGRLPPRWSDSPSRYEPLPDRGPPSSYPGPAAPYPGSPDYGTIITHPSQARERKPGPFFKLATLKPRVSDLMGEQMPETEEEEPKKSGELDHIDTASSFALSVILFIGLIFIVVNLFLFIFFIRQKRKLCMSGHQGRFGCGPSPSLPDSNLEARDEKYEIKSILKSADQLYDAVVRRTAAAEEWTDIYRPGSSSTVTIDPHTKVAEWMGQKVKNTNLRQNLSRVRTDSDNMSAATTSKVDKKNVKKVSVAVDATPSARSASVLKQIPIEMTKSLDFGRRRFGAKLRKEGAVSDDDSLTASHKDLTENLDFPPPPPAASQPALSSFNPHREDISVTTRDDPPPPLMSPEEALDNIKRRNFPKVLPDFPEDEPQGAANARLKRMSLPQPAETLKELGRKNPPPPPPRVSTLARTPLSNRNTVPNSRTKEKDLNVHEKHDKKSKVEKRPEPRVIIKPTLADPNAKKNPNSKIPRVTSKHSEKPPPPSPSAPSKHAQLKDPPKKPPGGVGAKLKVPPVKKTASTETAATSGTSGSSVSSVATVKKGH